MQAGTASAQRRVKKGLADEAIVESTCVISRDRLLAGRVSSLQECQAPGSYALHAISRSALQKQAVLPAGPPPGLLASEMSTKTSQDQLPSEQAPHQSEEYHVLLQNLPKAVLKESRLRVMVKEAHVKDVKKLVFRTDGKVLITLTSYASLCDCINHFNGLPWFEAPSCAVPSVIATHVQKLKNSRASVDKDGAQQLASGKLSVDAPVFVPGRELHKVPEQKQDSPRKKTKSDLGGA